MQGNEGAALVGVLVAEIEDAQDGQRAGRATGGRHPQLVADVDPEVAGHLGADEDVGRL